MGQNCVKSKEKYAKQNTHTRFMCGNSGGLRIEFQLDMSAQNRDENRINKHIS